MYMVSDKVDCDSVVLLLMLYAVAGFWCCGGKLVGVVVVEFPTTSMEMQAVADKFDRDGDGFIDYKEFITALRPERGEVMG